MKGETEKETTTLALYQPVHLDSNFLEDSFIQFKNQKKLGPLIMIAATEGGSVYKRVPGNDSQEEHTESFSYGRHKRPLLNAHTLLTIALGITSIVLAIALIKRPNTGNTNDSDDVFSTDKAFRIGNTANTVNTKHESVSSRWVPLPQPGEAMKTIVFGSCMKEDMPHPFWDTVADFNPQVTVLAGDNVYMEVKRCSDERCVELKQAYDTLDSHPSFVGARAKLPMVAILDDHDYGYNDCHAGNPFKDVAKDMFFDFFDIPPTDERRLRQNEGLYTSYEWGPIGQRLQLILLDTRYSRSKFLYDDDIWGYVAYNASQTNKRMLSNRQWRWLEKVLQRPANVRLIVSGIQVLSLGTWGFEHWALIPSELQRLKKLLWRYCKTAKGHKSLPVLLSGDRHIGAFYRDMFYDLHEVTASSWTHTIVDGWDPDGVKCEGDDCIEEDPARVGSWVGENHFGVVQIDWPKRKLDISLVRAETSHGFPVKSKWHHNTDAGEVLKKLSLDIP